MTIKPEDIGQLPNALVHSGKQNHQNLTLNATTSTAFVRDSKQMCRKIEISMQSTQLPSAPLEMKINQNVEQESRAQSAESIVVKQLRARNTATECSDMRTVKEEQRIKSEIIDESLIGFDSQPKAVASMEFDMESA